MKNYSNDINPEFEKGSIEELIKQLDRGDYSQFENGEYFSGNGFKKDRIKIPTIQ